MQEYINLTDAQGARIGKSEKIFAHKKGLLHEAFSLFIFNNQKELLLQKRAIGKYHSGGLWTNTCCSHPRYEELLETAIHRRLLEEMGFDCQMQNIGHIVYTAPFDNGLQEHEFDYLFIGTYPASGNIHPDPLEVSDWRWISLEKAENDANSNPENYTEWFKIIISKHLLEKHI